MEQFIQAGSPAHSAAQCNEEPSVKAGTILHAEDDENDAFLFRRALSNAGVSNPMVQVQNGEEAICYLTGTELYRNREQHPFPCLLITDLKMPRLSGFELLERIKDVPE